MSREIITHRQPDVAARDQTRAPTAPSSILRPLLGPYLLCRKPVKGWSGFSEAVDHLATNRNPHEFIARVLQREAQLPSEEELRRDLEALKAVEGEVTTGEQMARLVVAMCDAIPTFDAGKNPGYIDGLLLVLEAEHAAASFTPYALASATLKLFRAERFVPEPDKLVDAIRAEDKSMRSRVWFIQHTMQARANLRKIQSSIQEKEAV